MYHQINQIPIEVCSAEQKLAYNMTRKSYTLFQSRWNKAKNDLAKTRIAADIVTFAVDTIESAKSKSKEKYDMSAAVKIMYLNLFDYMENPKVIDPEAYAEIGKAFRKIEQNN